MPELSTKLHTYMLDSSKRSNSLPRRIARAIRDSTQPWIYGTEWGAIRYVPPLKHTLEHWVVPYVKSDHVAVEIGPGGGRWTRHQLGFSKLYAVEYYDPLLSELKKNFSKHKNIIFVKNNGFDFPNIADESVDFCFSFGVFVHFEFEMVEDYLKNINRIMKGNGNIVIHYSDKTKLMAREEESFGHNTPELMRRAVLAHGYTILEEDTTTLWHSSLIRFAKLLPVTTAIGES